ncbi:DUF624 domain-containing protein [Brachybacterium sp. YJGR34]|uniref:DUF624 domain-containing protein n=1 Tax=Brachybacterium sp. YJGR34 TaxID=2059911 RepID=UPI000E0B391E|nr:DUF624 domain-containing protein [Brachybacterium sp. YJGR34]
MDETVTARTPPTSRSTDHSAQAPRRGRGIREPDQPAAWSTRLSEAVDTLWLALRINLVWILLTLLGLVVLGAAPATAAAAGAFRAARHGVPVRVLPTMWASFRAELLGANLRMLPLLVVQAGSLAMVWMIAAGAVDHPLATAALGTLAAVAAGWATVGLGMIAVVPRVRDQELLVTWRLALMLPAALPLRSLSAVALLLAWVLLCSLLWPLALLVGAATAIGLTGALLVRRTELLLEDVKRRQDTTTAR